jgi:GT2 family glycosyltransferase
VTGRVAIVVLNWNGWERTVECLEAVRGLDYPDYLSVVVDNGSRDGSPARLREWAGQRGVRVVSCTRAEAEQGGAPEAERELEATPPARRLVIVENGENLGFAAGNNVGIRYALARNAEAVMLLNNDLLVAGDTLRRLVAALAENPQWAGVAPKVLSRESPTHILYAGGALHLGQARGAHLGRSHRDGDHWNGRHETEHLTACCALFRSRFLGEAHFLDEAFFFGHEDAALSIVAARLGWKLGVDLDCTVLHEEGASLAGATRTSVYYFSKYRLVLVHRYGSWLDRVLAPLFLVATRLVKLVVLAAQGRGRLASAELAGYRDFVMGRRAEFDKARANSRSPLASGLSR